MDRTGLQFDADGWPEGPGVFDALESLDDSAFDTVVRTIDDPSARARSIGMRADRAALRSLMVEEVPSGLLDAALDASGLEADGLAALEAGAPSIGGVPVSGIERYREPVVARLWRHRRVAGLMAAAVIVFVSGMAIVAGVRALGPTGRNGAGPGGVRTGPSVEPMARSGDIRPGVNMESVPGPGDAPALADAATESDWLSQMGETESGGVVASVFEASPMLGTGRVVLYARSGSAGVTDRVISAMREQRIGPDHAFAVLGDAPGLIDDTGLAAVGIPALGPRLIASEDGAPAEAVVARRSAWMAEVRRSPAALAALGKRLADAGLVVEFLVLDSALESGAASDGDGLADDVLWWSRPASAWDRSASVPVIIDSLPGD